MRVVTLIRIRSEPCLRVGYGAGGEAESGSSSGRARAAASTCALAFVGLPRLDATAIGWSCCRAQISHAGLPRGWRQPGARQPTDVERWIARGEALEGFQNAPLALRIETAQLLPAPAGEVDAPRAVAHADSYPNSRLISSREVSARGMSARPRDRFFVLGCQRLVVLGAGGEPGGEAVSILLPRGDVLQGLVGSWSRRARRPAGAGVPWLSRL